MSPPAIKSTGDHTGSPLHARSDLDTNIRLIVTTQVGGFPLVLTDVGIAVLAAFPSVFRE